MNFVPTGHTSLSRCGSQLPLPPPNMSTKKAAISSQYASVNVDSTSTTVDVTIQYRRRYFDLEASEIAPALRKIYETCFCGERAGRDSHTNNRLGNETTDGSRQPYQAGKLFRESKREEERCSITVTLSLANTQIKRGCHVH